MPIPQSKYYTADEFFNYTSESNERLELINGEIVAMSSPSELHQTLVGELFAEIRNYIKSNNGNCKPFVAPFDVKLDNSNVVIPDVSVICDKSKLDGKRCNGAPDWVIEVVSSNYKDDYFRKLNLYQVSGVREYWIVDPRINRTFVYFFEDMKEDSNIIGFYDFNQTIPVGIYKDKPIQLEINIAKLLEL